MNSTEDTMGMRAATERDKSFHRSIGHKVKTLYARRFLAFLLLIAGYFLGTAACATPMNGGEMTQAIQDPPEQVQQEMVHTPSLHEGYRLGIGDVVVINVWREPVLSGETFVRNDGRISMNLLGDVDAVGRTPMALRGEIQDRLSDYIENPVVTVTLKNPTSQKYYVIGEVNSPGEYDLITDLTFLQAIARAGGFSEWASKRRVVIIRHTEHGEERIPVSYDDIVRGRDTAQNIVLQANDTIVVP